MLASVPSTPFPFGDNPLIDAGFWTARMTAVKVIGRYLGLLMWPAQLSFDYSFNENPLFGGGWSAEDLKAVLALLVCVAGAIAAVVCWRRRQPVFFGIAFFFATLSPTSEPGDSHRQHHGGTLSVSAVGGVRGVGSLRGAMGVAAADGKAAGIPECDSRGGGRAAFCARGPHVCAQCRLGGPGTLLEERGGSGPRQLQDEPLGREQYGLSDAGGLGSRAGRDGTGTGDSRPAARFGERRHCVSTGGRVLP